jgi:hypothetical protein
MFVGSLQSGLNVVIRPVVVPAPHKTYLIPELPRPFVAPFYDPILLTRGSSYRLLVRHSL